MVQWLGWLGFGVTWVSRGVIDLAHLQYMAHVKDTIEAQALYTHLSLCTFIFSRPLINLFNGQFHSASTDLSVSFYHYYYICMSMYIWSRVTACIYIPLNNLNVGCLNRLMTNLVYYIYMVLKSYQFICLHSRFYFHFLSVSLAFWWALYNKKWLSLLCMDC